MSSLELSQYMVELGEKPYHGKQVYRAVYGKRQFKFKQMSELSKDLRERLHESAQITLPSLHASQLSEDGTRKYLLQLKDGRRIEAVCIPEERRNTLCISTQVGCAMECQFCLTALMGFGRNLTAGEITGQVLFILADQFGPAPLSSSKPKPTNVVLMGMGEPLHNLSNVSKALVLMTDKGGMGIPCQRITLSTAGVVPKIRELAECPVVPNLAISLSATTDETRNRLMPINRKYPIRQLLDACAEFPLGPRQEITFEYVLIDKVNDTDADARRLVKLLAPLRAKVNLLPLNPGNERELRPSPPDRVIHFQKTLTSKGLRAFVRRPRGTDILAACGQLHEAKTQSRVTQEDSYGS